jgi:surface polysaccharide O-acyltransferase-like enzyme
MAVRVRSECSAAKFRSYMSDTADIASKPQDVAKGAAVTPASTDFSRQPVFREIPEAPATPTFPTPPHAAPHAAWGDVIRIVGTIAVVASHITAELIQGGYKRHLPDAIRSAHSLTFAEFWSANLVDSFARFAVPVFVMLSGALLLKARPIDGKRFYQRRLSRVLVPAIFFTAAFGALVWRGHGLEALLKNLAEGAPVAHLHFIFRILGLYAFTPMLCVFLAGADRRMVWTTTLLIFALGSIHGAIMPALGYHSTIVGMFVPFLGYYLAGYLLRDVVLGWKGLLLASVGLLVGWAGVALGCGYLWQHHGNTLSPTIPVTMLFYDFLNPFRIGMSVCAFILIRSLFDRPWPDSGFWRFISFQLAPATLGIYLLHPLVQDVLKKLGLHSYRLPVAVGVPLLTVLVFAITAAIVITMMRIPYVNWIVGGRIGERREGK